MAQITAALVKELRDSTGVGMMDCKKALTKVEGDLEAAVDWLRKSGLAAAAKKAGRVAAEGLVSVKTRGTAGAIIEVNAETDFVARNLQFQEFVARVAEIALTEGGDHDKINNAAVNGGASVSETATNLIATIGENISLRRSAGIDVSNGVVASYIHNMVAPNAGKIGVLIALESDGDSHELMIAGRQLAMHVAAAAPRWTEIDDVDAAVLDKEREILSAQARESGKPEDIIEKMLEGRLRKFYEEVVLMEQKYVIDGESKVRKVLEIIAEKVCAPVKLLGFIRFELGEGVEREEGDFAAEVAAVAKS